MQSFSCGNHFTYATFGRFLQSAGTPHGSICAPAFAEGKNMNHVYKQIELTGSSPVSSDEAIKTAIGKASETVRKIDWFEVMETRGEVEDGEIAHWQVTVKIGF